MSETSLADRAGEFLRLMDDLTRTIPVHQLKESLALVVTKQGTNRYSKPHQKLKEIVGAKVGHALTEDVKQLLLHLTDGDNIHARVLFFPCPNTINCEYDSQKSRAKILESIIHLRPILNPDVKMQLPPESMNYVRELADNLNDEVYNSINILKSRVLHLCKAQAESWHSDDALERLGTHLAKIKSALALLNADIVSFADPLSHFFEDEPNIVSECLQTLTFLKTLSDEVKYSKSKWFFALQSTVGDIHKVIDDLSKRLGNLISDHITGTIKPKVTTFCTKIPESTPQEVSSKKVELDKVLNEITYARGMFLHGTKEDMMDFAGFFNTFFDDPKDNVLLKPIEALTFLREIKRDVKYPIKDWFDAFSSLRDHIKSLIDQQQDIIIKAKVQAGKEEATRIAREETATQLKILTQKGDAERQHLTEQHQAQVEADRRKREKIEAERQNIADKLQKHVEKSRLKREEQRNEAREQLKAQDETLKKVTAALETAQEILGKQLKANADQAEKAQKAHEDLTARIIKTEQAAAQQLQAQRAETEKAQNEARRQNILRRPPNTEITLPEYNLLRENERKYVEVPKRANGKIVKGNNGKPVIDKHYYKK